MDPFLKRSIAAMMGIAAISTLQAQELRLGGGYTGSNVRKSGTENWVGRAGYQLGVDLVLGQRFFLKPGLHLQVRNLNYSVLGVGQDGLPNGTETEFRYTSRSLRVPALLGVRLLDPLDENEFNLYVVAGPTALIGIGADLNNSGFDITTRGTQWYLGFGGGMEYKFLFVEGGYDVALSNVFSGEGLNTNPKVNNVYLSGGLRFVLKGASNL